MTNSKDNTEAKSVALPDFPDTSDYKEEQRELPLDAQLKLMEEMLPVWNKDRCKRLSELPIITEPFYL
ncbi:MAG: hypothetical protein KDD55_01300 [Bdellovibrionales bacterium]|nr:hypothetical protein [Bdellovibrionales bacterium]